MEFHLYYYRFFNVFCLFVGEMISCFFWNQQFGWDATWAFFVCELEFFFLKKRYSMFMFVAKFPFLKKTTRTGVWYFHQNGTGMCFSVVGKLDGFWTPKTKSMWMFPKIVGFPPKSSILTGFSMIFTIHFGVPLFLETPMYRWFCFFNLGIFFFGFQPFIFLRFLVSVCRSNIYIYGYHLQNLVAQVSSNLPEACHGVRRLGYTKLRDFFPSEQWSTKKHTLRLVGDGNSTDFLCSALNLVEIIQFD